MSNPIDQRIGRNIRRYREAVGLTQAKLATALAALGWAVSDTAVAKIESGTRTLRVNQLALIARALGRSMEDFLASSDTTDIRNALEEHGRLRLKLTQALEAYLQSQRGLKELLALSPEKPEDLDWALEHAQVYEYINETVQDVFGRVQGELDEQ